MSIRDNKKIKTLDDMIHSYDYDAYQGDYMGLQARILSGESNPEIITHRDNIEYMRNFLNDVLYRELSETKRNKIHREINKVEKYHKKYDTIDEVVTDYGDTE